MGHSVEKDLLSEQEIRRRILDQIICPDVRCMDEIDSTNSYLKREALLGAPHGMVAIAESQSAGRGRMGRSFLSLPGRGVYLSVLLRPDIPAERLMTATGMAAVAVCRAVEAVCDARPGIKWTNDLVLNGRKLCGILAETVLMGRETALIIGAGINVSHSQEDFGPEIGTIATSLVQEGYEVSRAELAAAMIREFYRLGESLGGDTKPWVEEYLKRCVTIGKGVQLLWTEGKEQAVAIDIDETFGLVVRCGDGAIKTVRSGEVSVRGLYGYAE